MGILLLISLTAVINLSVATAMAPAKGLPLPFISAGGSAMMVGGLSVGLLWAISRQEILSRCQPTYGLENPDDARSRVRFEGAASPNLDKHCVGRELQVEGLGSSSSGESL